MFNMNNKLKRMKLAQRDKKLFEIFNNVVFYDFDRSIADGSPVFYFWGKNYGLRDTALAVETPELLTFCTKRLSESALKKLQTNIPHFQDLCEELSDSSVFTKAEWEKAIEEAVKMVSKTGKKGSTEKTNEEKQM